MEKRIIAVIGTGSKTLTDAIARIDKKETVMRTSYDQLKKWNNLNKRETVPYSYFKNRIRIINESTHLDFLESVEYVVKEEKVYTYVSAPGFQ